MMKRTSPNEPTAHDSRFSSLLRAASRSRRSSGANAGLRRITL